MAISYRGLKAIHDQQVRECLERSTWKAWRTAAEDRGRGDDRGSVIAELGAVAEDALATERHDAPRWSEREVAHLHFVRWLFQTGRLEHEREPAERGVGSVAADSSTREGRPNDSEGDHHSPRLRPLVQALLGIGVAVVWLLLLLVTGFSSVAVAVGLLVALGMLNA